MSINYMDNKNLSERQKEKITTAIRNVLQTTVFDEWSLDAANQVYNSLYIVKEYDFQFFFIDVTEALLVKHPIDVPSSVYIAGHLFSDYPSLWDSMTAQTWGNVLMGRGHKVANLPEFMVQVVEYLVILQVRKVGEYKYDS